MRGPILQPPPGKCPEREQEGEKEEKGKEEVADFELLALDFVHLNNSSALVDLRPDCTLELPRCPEKWDRHLLGYDLDPGIFQSFPGNSNVQPGEN